MSSYTGRDGQSHEYTNIDWDKTLNTKVSAHKHLSKKELGSIQKSLAIYQKECLKKILEINPALAGELYESYVIRDMEKRQLRWDETLLEGRLATESPITGIFFPTMLATLEKREEAFKNNNLDLKTPQVKH